MVAQGSYWDHWGGHAPACRNVGNLRVEVQDPGAVLMLVSLISAWNLPAAIVEGFWALISIYGLLKHGGWLGLR